jgi:CHAD domain-containing protein
LEKKATPSSIRAIRIQVRRLRALIRFFQPLLPAREWQFHADRLRQWGALLGSIRDIDLMEKAWSEFSRRYYPDSSYSLEWMYRIHERREFLAENVVYRLGQGELTQNVFALQAWLYSEIERESIDAEGQKAEAFVRKLLLKTVKELREDIRDICSSMDSKIQHRLRIRIKNLRYILEALSVIQRYRDDFFLASLQKLQTGLGKIHDILQIKSLLNEFETGSSESDRDAIKELFISWRSRELWEKLSALPTCAEELRKTAKAYLRTLAAMRAVRRTKPRHDSGAHEPSQ